MRLAAEPPTSPVGARTQKVQMGCSQNHGPLLVMNSITAPKFQVCQKGTLISNGFNKADPRIMLTAESWTPDEEVWFFEDHQTFSASSVTCSGTGDPKP